MFLRTLLRTLLRLLFAALHSQREHLVLGGAAATWPCRRMDGGDTARCTQAGARHAFIRMLPTCWTSLRVGGTLAVVSERVVRLGPTEWA